MNRHVSDNDLSAVVSSDKMHVWHHLFQHKKLESVDPTIMIEGDGLYLWDQTGKKYLDAVSGGIWTVNVGYGRESIADAVRDQLVKLNFFAGTLGTIPGATFAKRLIEKMPGMSRVYYSNSGSEANEKAYKIVRQISHKRHGGRKHKILYRERDYHGTTITALSSGGHHQRRDQYGPLTPGFVEVPHCLKYRSQYGDVDDYGIRAADAIERVILQEGADTVGGIILEPITAGGGVITPPAGYWDRVQEICSKYELILIIDEVVCGMGRTGTWFGYQHYGVKPDIVTMAKGVASGYAAISCTVTTEQIFELFKDDADDPLNYFRDVSTYGGCTAGPAAALENMRILEDEDLLNNSERLGEHLFGCLKHLQSLHPNRIGDVRGGKGLFSGIELVIDSDSRAPLPESLVQGVIADTKNNHGVIIGGSNRSFDGMNNTLFFSPSLCCTKEQIDEITAAVDDSLSRIEL